jgi:hypothetical protein
MKQKHEINEVVYFIRNSTICQGAITGVKYKYEKDGFMCKHDEPSTEVDAGKPMLIYKLYELGEQGGREWEFFIPEYKVFGSKEAAQTFLEFSVHQGYAEQKQQPKYPLGSHVFVMDENRIVWGIVYAIQVNYLFLISKNHPNTQPGVSYKIIVPAYIDEGEDDWNLKEAFLDLKYEDEVHTNLEDLLDGMVQKFFDDNVDDIVGENPDNNIPW